METPKKKIILAHKALFFKRWQLTEYQKRMSYFTYWTYRNLYHGGRGEFQTEIFKGKTKRFPWSFWETQQKHLGEVWEIIRMCPCEILSVGRKVSSWVGWMQELGRSYGGDRAQMDLKMESIRIHWCYEDRDRRKGCKRGWFRTWGLSEWWCIIVMAVHGKGKETDVAAMMFGIRKIWVSFRYVDEYKKSLLLEMLVLLGLWHSLVMRKKKEVEGADKWQAR